MFIAESRWSIEPCAYRRERGVGSGHSSGNLHPGQPQWRHDRYTMFIYSL